MWMILSLVALLTFFVQISGNDGEWVSDVHDGGANHFLRYPSEENEASYIRAISQVHEEPNEEVQYGRAQASVYSDELCGLTWSR
jgi:hypothetical protein